VAIIQADPATRTSKLEDGLRYAEANGIDVFESENNPSFPIVENQAEWDSRYYARTLAYLENNFTKERLLHAIEVGRVTHPEQCEPARPVQAEESGKTEKLEWVPDEPKKSSHTTHRKPERSGLPLALLAGGAVAALLLYLFLKK